MCKSGAQVLFPECRTYAHEAAPEGCNIGTPSADLARLAQYRHLRRADYVCNLSSMAVNRRKQRVNLSVDPAIYAAASARFKTVDMSISAFIEAQMALFLQMTEPLTPLFESVDKGETDPVALKTAMRAMFSGATVEIGEVKISGPLTGGFSPKLVDTDKK